MADDTVIIDIIIKAQDQARALLEKQIALLGQMSSGVNALVASQAKAAQASQAAAKSANQQGDALDRLLRTQKQIDLGNQRAVAGFGALNKVLQQGTLLNANTTGALRALGTAVQKNTGFMAQHGAEWNGFMGQVKMGTPVTAEFTGKLNSLGAAFKSSLGPAEESASTFQRVGTASVAVTAALGGLAATILNSLVGAMSSAVQQASLFQSTFAGLGSIAKSFGQNVGDVTQAAKDLASDGLISVRDSAITLKNLIASGFNLDQAMNLAKGFKDIASFNRQASMDMGYAVSSASEGIKNQNCVIGSTEVLTDLGYIQIGDIFKRKLDICVVSWDERNQKYAKRRVVGLAKNGVRKTFRLTLTNGRTIEATPNHRFMTPKGLKFLSDLRKGDTVLTWDELAYADATKYITPSIENHSCDFFPSTINLRDIENHEKRERPSSLVANPVKNHFINATIISTLSALAGTVQKGVVTLIDQCIPDTNPLYGFHGLSSIANGATVNENSFHPLPKRFGSVQRTAEMSGSQKLGCVERTTQIGKAVNPKSDTWLCLPERINAGEQPFSNETATPASDAEINAGGIYEPITSNHLANFLNWQQWSRMGLRSAKTATSILTPRLLENLRPQSSLVANVEYVGLQEVYDLEVEGTHTMIGNGILQGQSLLVDNAGLTKNLTIILKEMGLSEQDLSKIQTDVNIRTKFYNGLLKEMSMASGDAVKVLDTFAGSQSKLAVQFQLLQVQIGEYLLPALTKINNVISDFIGYLRNNESIMASVVRTVAILTAAFVAFAAIGVSIAAIIAAVSAAGAILEPVLVELGWTIGGVVTVVGGWALGLAVIVTALILWYKTVSDGSDTLDKQNVKYRDQINSIDGLIGKFNELRVASGKIKGADISMTGDNAASKEFQSLVEQMHKDFPDLKVDVTNLNTALEGLSSKLTDVDGKLIENETNIIKVKLANLGLVGSIAEMKQALADQEAGFQGSHTLLEDLGTLISGRLKIAWEGLKNDIADIGKALREAKDDVATFFGWLEKIPVMKAVISTLGDGFGQMRRDIGNAADGMRQDTSAQIELGKSLVSQLEGWSGTSKELTETEKRRREEKEKLAAAERDYGALIKGQISTSASYSDAQKKLADDIANLTTATAGHNAMTKTAAMRLPEIVKQSKELMSAYREGVAPVDANAFAIEKWGKSIERTRRIQQEAADHLLEYGDRSRALARSFEDQTVGVDSLAKQNQLLTEQMDAAGVTFDSSREKLQPFIPLMKTISDHANDMGQSFKDMGTGIDLGGIQDALKSAGVDPTSKFGSWMKDTLQKDQAERSAANAKYLSDVSGVLGEEVKQVQESQEKIRQLRLQTQEISVSRERDSLKKRMAPVTASFEAQLREINVFTTRGQAEYDALLTWYGAQAGATRQTWEKDFYGPTKKDLQDTADESRTRFMEMKESSDYTAEQVAVAWKKSYDDQQAASKKNFDVFRSNLRAGLENVTKISESLANIAGKGQFSEMAQWVGTISGAMVGASDAADKWKESMAAFDDGQIAQGIASMTVAIGGMVQAMAAATNSSSKMKNVIGGAMAGAQIGAVAGPWGMVGGAIIGGIIGALRKPEWTQVQKQIKNDLGFAASDGLAKGIETLEKSLGVDRNTAIALNLSKIMEESKGSIKNFDQEIDTLFTTMANGAPQIAKLATEELDKAFATMITNVNGGLRGLADGAMLNFIDRAKASGQEIKAVTEFLKQMGDQGLTAINGVVGAFTGRFTKITDLTAQINDMVDKRRKLSEDMSKEKVGSAAWEKLNSELTKLNAEFDKAQQKAARLIGLLSDPGNNGQDRFDRLGRLLGSTFDAALASGKNFLEALQAIHPALDGMAQAAAAAGLTISASLQELINLDSWAQSNEEIATGITQLDSLMKALANQGAVTQGVFDDFGNEANAQFKDLINGGLNSDQALRLMQPTLQTLWELQNRFGYAVDETTQQMLNEAEAAGTVGAAHQTASERMVDGINKVVSRMELLLGYFGVKIPNDADEAGNAMENAVDKPKSATQELNDELENTRRRYEEARQAAIDFGQSAYDATNGVVYGNSPGGINDLIAHLLDAIRGYGALENTAVTTGEAAVGSMKKWVDTLQNLTDTLTEETLSGFALTMFQMHKEQGKMIEQFLKDMEGASQDLIDSGLATINQIFAAKEAKARQSEAEQRQSDTTAAQDKRNSSGVNAAMRTPRITALGNGQFRVEGGETANYGGYNALDDFNGAQSGNTYHVNISTIDAANMEDVVEQKIIPQMEDSFRSNRRQSRTNLRTLLGVNNNG